LPCDFLWIYENEPKDGHQSTVATLGFSADAIYLVKCIKKKAIVKILLTCIKLRRSILNSSLFSIISQYLFFLLSSKASSGKDRRICLWTRNGKKDTLYQLAAVKSMAHKRIIWSLHWCPHVPNSFATGSRDGLVKIWMVLEKASQSEIILIHAFEPISAARKKHQNLEGKPQVEPVTAVSFSPVVYSGVSSILAVGLESGVIELWSVGSMDVVMEIHAVAAFCML
jgi:WD40 repeat protein